jgi:hypothetical protein
MSERVEILRIFMLQDGFEIEVHPLIPREEGAFVRDRLAEMLPVLVEQIADPETARKIPMVKGNAYGVLYEITDRDQTKKPH